MYIIYHFLRGRRHSHRAAVDTTNRLDAGYNSPEASLHRIIAVTSAFIVRIDGIEGGVRGYDRIHGVGGGHKQVGWRSIRLITAVRCPTHKTTSSTRATRYRRWESWVCVFHNAGFRGIQTAAVHPVYTKRRLSRNTWPGQNK